MNFNLKLTYLQVHPAIQLARIKADGSYKAPARRLQAARSPWHIYLSAADTFIVLATNYWNANAEHCESIL